MAGEVGTAPSKPRSAQRLRQQHRTNAPAGSIQESYKWNSAIAFLDHIITNLESRFSDLSIKATTLLNLVRSVICSAQPMAMVEAADTYNSDMLSPELLDFGLMR